MTDSILQSFIDQQVKQQQRLPHLKAALLTALRAANIELVEIEYDGEGDSGQIGGVRAYRDERVALELDTSPLELAVEPGEPPTRFTSLEAAIEDFAWHLLDCYHAGFVNNDGGFGYITIRVADATVTLDHNDRYLETHNTLTEV